MARPYEGKLRRVTAVEVAQHLHYNPYTGVFTWREDHGRKIKAGQTAGALMPHGYIHIQLNGGVIGGHRAAWLYSYGWLPPEIEVDHYNGIRWDNKLGNLRRCTDGGVNQHNIKEAFANNELGLLGVYHLSGCKRGRGFRSTIQVYGERIFLGIHKTPELAHQAYLEAKRELHEFCTI